MSLQITTCLHLFNMLWVLLYAFNIVPALTDTMLYSCVHISIYGLGYSN